MKPRRLVIHGLRSYRDRTEIDFSEASLFAIVGDTGAGKSSILEAIVFALYSAATWTRQAGDLISDGMRTMTVEMQFEVDGREWLVKRSMSRDGYPPPIHHLSSIDDPTERYDQRASVDAAVENLLGLSFEAFTSAVILPQGRFERLLVETPANRTNILKGIFRLEQLGEARELARTTAEQYRPRLERLRIARAALLPDPREAAREATERLKGAEVRIAELSQVNADIANIERRTVELRTEIRALDVENDRLAAARLAVDPVLGVRLGKLRAELDAEANRLSQATTHAVAAEDAAGEAIEAARQQGLDTTTLARHRTSIDHARTSAPTLRTRREDLAQEEAALAEADGVREAEDQTLASLAKRSAETFEGERAADQASTAARGRLDALRLADSAERTALSELAASESPIAEQRELCDELARRLATATTAEAHAADALGKAETDLELARERGAAALASHGHTAGDPCPVCARRLPADWNPPVDTGRDEATRVRDQSRSTLLAATSAASQARGELQVAEARFLSLNDQRQVLTERWDRARQAIEGLVPGWAPGMTSTDILAGVHVAAAAAAEELARRRTAARAATADEAAARAAADQRLASIASRRLAAERMRSQIETDEKLVAAAVAALPDDLAVTMSSTVEDFERVIAKLDRFDTAAAELLRVQVAARSVALASRAAEVSLARRRTKELDEPETEFRLATSRLAAAVDRARAIAGETVDVETTEDQAVAETERVGAVIKKVQESRASDLEAAETALQGLFEKAGVSDRTGLTQALAEANGAKGAASEALARAQHDLPIATDLDGRIAAGGRLIDTLVELTRLLGDGAFVGYVVEARQRALLAIATAILIEMSGDRYGFAEDFRIVDRLSGQPRSAKTLSGGETFQASLALALGLVELAGRSGGRLSSLFLDEGFGTLDANALDEALEELERRAAAGRVIGIISHLRSIAERLEHVLRVDRVLGTTHVRWITGEEASQFDDEDLGHLRGLTG